MFKVCLLFLTSLIIGCSTTSYRILTPYEVSIIPLDCLNKKQIVNWLEEQINYANQNPKQYNENINALKYKLWEIRTSCPR